MLRYGSWEERRMLERAVDIAEENARLGQRPFGAVVVLDAQIVGEGANSVLTGGDPTEHAEMIAMRAACLALKVERLDGAVVYASAEPCAMCQATGVQLGIDRMIFAARLAEAARVGFPAPERASALKVAWSEIEPGYATRAETDDALSNRPFVAWASVSSEL